MFRLAPFIRFYVPIFVTYQAGKNKQRPPNEKSSLLAALSLVCIGLMAFCGGVLESNKMAATFCILALVLLASAWFWAPKVRGGIKNCFFLLSVKREGGLGQSEKSLSENTQIF